MKTMIFAAAAWVLTGSAVMAGSEAPSRYSPDLISQLVIGDRVAVSPGTRVTLKNIDLSKLPYLTITARPAWPDATVEIDGSAPATIPQPPPR
jgi:hypothetical protein